jgi:predicted nucleic acid-binding protein
MLIYLIEQSPRYGARVEAALERYSPQMCWTELTRLECRTKPLREENHSLLIRLDGFFAQPAAIFCALTRTSFDLATTLRARHRLKTPDALHLAAAIEAGCTEFWTNDHRLDNAASGYLHTVTL